MFALFERCHLSLKPEDDNLEIVRKDKRRLEYHEGRSSEVRAESLGGNHLNELLNMSEYALEALDSVNPTFDAEASERMNEHDVGERFVNILCGIVQL